MSYRKTTRRTSNRGQYWTKQQEQTLRKDARQLPTKKIAQKQGRTVTAIRSKAHSLGISLGQKPKQSKRRR